MDSEGADMLKDWPITLVTLTIWAYWGTVILLVLYKHVRYGQKSGVIPRARWEKRLWWGIVAVWLAWNTLPFLAGFLSRGPFALPIEATEPGVVASLRWAAASVGVLCYLATLYCWLLMGRSWSMAIVPGQKTDLVTTGLFGVVRHPIYSLGILLMVCTAIVVATLPMLVAAVAYIALLNYKARKEEEYLTSCHGEAYRGYCQRVGRFLPRFR